VTPTLTSIPRCFNRPGDKSAKDRLLDLPVFVPAAELDKAKQEAIAAKDAQTAEVKAEEGKARRTAVSIPAACTSTIAGTRRRGKRLDCRDLAR